MFPNNSLLFIQNEKFFERNFINKLHLQQWTVSRIISSFFHCKIIQIESNHNMILPHFYQRFHMNIKWVSEKLDYDEIRRLFVYRKHMYLQDSYSIVYCYVYHVYDYIFIHFFLFVQWSLWRGIKEQAEKTTLITVYGTKEKSWINKNRKKKQIHLKYIF